MLTYPFAIAFASVGAAFAFAGLALSLGPMLRRPRTGRLLRLEIDEALAKNWRELQPLRVKARDLEVHDDVPETEAEFRRLKAKIKALEADQASLVKEGEILRQPDSEREVEEGTPAGWAYALLATSVMLFLLAAGLAIADRAIAAPPSPTTARSTKAGDGPGGEEGGERDALTADVAFVDVGQGDATVMRVGGKFIVSDAGDKNVAEVDAALRRLGASLIDVAILSHPNRDHVANFVPLLKTYGWTIGTALLSRSGYWTETLTNRRILRALRASGTRLDYVSRGERFLWGGARWEILNPPEGSFTAASSAASNNASVAYVLVIHGRTLLFTGDIGPKVEAEVARRWKAKRLGRASVFLATHHGSKGGSTWPLLSSIRPNWVVLSVGRNGHGHPSAEATQRLERIGASIWCTYVNGTVTAHVAASGRVSWQTRRQPAPWWKAGVKTGKCYER